MPQSTPALIITGGGPSNELPGIDNSLPGGGSVSPPIYYPPPPPGIWPPPVRPIQPLPPGHPMPPGSVWPPIVPVDPGYGQGHPMPPHVGGGPMPGRPPHVGGGPVPPEGETKPPEESGGSPPSVGGGPSQPPPSMGQLPTSQKHLVAICDITQGGGMRVIGYTVVDPSLSPWPNPPSVDNTLPGSRPPSVDNTLPPSAQPKR